MTPATQTLALLACAAALLTSPASPTAAAQPASPPPPTPTALLRAADQALGWSTGVRYRVRVEAVGSVALDQSTLELEVRARPTSDAWQFWIAGEAVLPDGQTRRPIALTTDASATRVLNHDRRVVTEATGATGVTLLNEASVMPAVFWLAAWERLVTEQMIDGGDGLTMRYAGPRLANAQTCDAVHVDYTKLDPQLGTLRDLWWFFDRQTHLPVRIEACHFRRDQNAFGYQILTITELDTEATLSDEDMALQVPTGFIVETFELPELDDAEMGGPRVGERATQWTLKDADGAAHSLSDYRGQIVVMDFWATWCGPCVAAMPKLQALHERYEGRPVHILGLNMSEPEDPAAFMASRGFDYGLLVEADDVAGAYEVNSIPALWVIGPEGTVLFRQTGFTADLEQKLQAVIDRALRTIEDRPDDEAEPAPDAPEQKQDPAGDVPPP